MSKAITDGIALMPLPYAAGLDRWSCENGRPGEATLADLLEAKVLDDDPVFGSCLQLLKDRPVTQLRYKVETPIMPGFFLRISARVRVKSGPLPTVRIAGWPGRAGIGGSSDNTTTGPAVPIEAIDTIVKVSAIVGTAERTGVDMVWQDAIYGHFGLDLTGPTGATVIVDNLLIEDVSADFQGALLAAIDVRDFGAIADATTDATAAFLAADRAAQGRDIVVPAGVFYLGSHIRLYSTFKFIGTIVQPHGQRFVLAKSLNFASYCKAFGDVETAFRKAFQAISYIDEPAILDLGGAKVPLAKPLDFQGCDPEQATSKAVKVLRNGTFLPIPSTEWTTDVTTCKATHDPADARHLRDVEGCKDIPVGARVVSQGVGREVYVEAVDVATRSLTLSMPLYAATGTQKFSFHRYKYLLDFSGYDEVAQFQCQDLTLACDGVASGIMLATQGRGFTLRNCQINDPKDRGLTSAGTGCVGMTIRGSNIRGDADQNNRHETIGFNANGNYLRVHDSGFSHLTQFAVIAGAAGAITGNEWTNGHHVERSRPQGGLILTKPLSATVVTANSFMNAALIWTSEHANAQHGEQPSTFGGLTITGNSFTTNALAHWITFLQVAPHGEAHVLDGMSVVGNVFRSVNGRINRVEMLDTRLGQLSLDHMKAVSFSANTFHGVRDPIANPANLVHDQRDLAACWTAETHPNLPFIGLAKWVESASPVGPITDADGRDHNEPLRCVPRQGADGRQVQFDWSKPVTGRVRYQVRMDDPF